MVCRISIRSVSYTHLDVYKRQILGSLGPLFGIQDSPVFTGFVRACVTFTSLFSTFLNFIIPLLIVSFVAAGLADLGKKANRLFAITLILAYVSTIIAGFASFFAGKALLRCV